MVTHQLQVERRTGKVRRPETDVLPLSHATNPLPVLSSENLLMMGSQIGDAKYCCQRVSVCLSRISQKLLAASKDGQSKQRCNTELDRILHTMRRVGRRDPTSSECRRKRGTATVQSDREMHAPVGGGISRPPRGRRPAAGSPSCSRNSVACRRDSTRLRFYLATNEQTRRVYPSWSVRRKSAPADFFETIIDGPCGWRA